MRIESVTRRQLFHKHPFVRAEIHYIQHQEASLIIDSDPAYWRRVRRYYDLCEKGEPCPVLPQSEFSVLAYPAETRLAYTRYFIPTLVRCFQAMGVTQWIVVQPLAFPWTEYGFANARKRAYFHRITNGVENAVGFTMDHAGLQQFLQACLFAHPDGPRFLFFSHDHPAAISGFLCKDGNVHINLSYNAVPLLKDMAIHNGLLLGDLPICSVQHHSMWRS